MKRETGITLVELLIASAVGMLIVLMVGFVFVRQSKNYTDMQDQATLQAQSKKAQQMITNELSNVNAGLAHNTAFTQATDSIKFSYRDLKGKHCNVNDSVTITYKITSVSGGKALVRQKQCNSGATTQEAMVTSDSVSLNFAYETSERTTWAGIPQDSIKLIQYEITVYTKNKKDLFQRNRLGRVQVWLGAT